MAKSDSTKLPANVKDETGNVYGKLTVIGFIGIRGNAARWHCRCECGKHTDVRGAMLRSGNARSCGCTRCLVNGLYHTSEHRIWSGMIQRCTNPKNPRYSSYGGRGIKVCERWRTSFLAFYRDMGPKPFPEATIDRIDNDGNYEPGNCRWATKQEQSQNTRRSRMLTYNGESMCIAEWASRFGLKRATLAARINHGWPIEEALHAPLSFVRHRYSPPSLPDIT